MYRHSAECCTHVISHKLGSAMSPIFQMGKLRLREERLFKAIQKANDGARS